MSNIDKINCKVDCVNGCIAPEHCASKEDREKAAKFISETSLDQMIEIAEIARLKKINEPPKWVIPDEYK
jgi:hypothetical protein